MRKKVGGGGGGGSGGGAKGGGALVLHNDPGHVMAGVKVPIIAVFVPSPQMAADRTVASPLPVSQDFKKKLSSSPAAELARGALFSLNAPSMTRLFGPRPRPLVIGEAGPPSPAPATTCAPR